jgi:hypothetical protein
MPIRFIAENFIRPTSSGVLPQNFRTEVIFPDLKAQACYILNEKVTKKNHPN